MVRGIVELCKAFPKQREGTHCTEQVEVISELYLEKEKDLTCQEVQGQFKV